MRMWQPQGFNEKAKAILSDTIQVGYLTITTFDMNGNIVSTETDKPKIELRHTSKVYKVDQPFYNCDQPLYRHYFDDGRILEDYVQTEPWSGGPCTFLALREHSTLNPIEETLWSDEEIKKVTG